MKVIFMGTPDFAVGTLEALHEAGHEITLVVSQPDKPKGRGHALQPTPVKAAAEHLGLPVFQPAKVREAADMLEQTPADVIVVAAGPAGLAAAITAVIDFLLGLVISFLLSTPTGASIVLVNLCVLLIVTAIQKIRGK